MARSTILTAYSEWTALSAMRSKAPIKSRADIYPLLRGATFSEILDLSRGPITPDVFDKWHKKTTKQLMSIRSQLKDQAGWATKLLNVYLKTYAYIGDGGRQNIRECLHPPIDSGLWSGIRRRFDQDRDILDDTHCVRSISRIADYEDYERIIRGLRLAAQKTNCRLIEVEQFWEGTMLTEQL